MEIKIDSTQVTDTSVMVQATCWDLERNVSVPGFSTASIIGKYGRYPQHLIETTVLACVSKARRNAIQACIPKAYITYGLTIAKEVASKNRKPLADVRKEMIDWFARSKKVNAKQLCDHLGLAGVDDMTYEHIDELRAIAEALSSGEAKPEEFFDEAESTIEVAKRQAAERREKAEAAKQSKQEPSAEARQEPKPATANKTDDFKLDSGSRKPSEGEPARAK